MIEREGARENFVLFLLPRLIVANGRDVAASLWPTLAASQFQRKALAVADTAADRDTDTAADICRYRYR